MLPPERVRVPSLLESNGAGRTLIFDDEGRRNRTGGARMTAVVTLQARTEQGRHYRLPTDVRLRGGAQVVHRRELEDITRRSGSAEGKQGPLSGAG